MPYGLFSLKAFKDLDALIDKVYCVLDTAYTLLLVKAKDMVGLVNKFAAKMEDKKGSVSEDEVSLLLVWL